MDRLSTLSILREGASVFIHTIHIPQSNKIFQVIKGIGLSI